MRTVTSSAIGTDDAARLRDALGTPGASLTVGSTTVVLSDALRRAVETLFEELAGGHDVTLGAAHRYLSTGQAARLLQVSRPTLVKLCEDGLIDYEQLASHRRIRWDSLTRFLEDAARRRALGLTAYAATDTGEVDTVVTTR